MNVSRRVKIIEHIKSIILVVLFLWTILLLYFVWGDGDFGAAAEEQTSQRPVAIEPLEIFQPDRMEVSFGGGVYNIINEHFDLLMSCFKTFSEGRNLIVEEISQELYEEIVSRQSIRAVFEYLLPFNVLIELHGINRISGSDNIDIVSEIAYVSGLDDTLFIRDRRAGQYFRIAGTVTDYFDRLREAVEGTPSDQVYFPLTTFVGGEIENKTLWPESVVSNIHDLSFSGEDFFAQESAVTEMVRSLFKGNFDFVRRIEEDSGTVMYMYGYGQIVVIAHHTGILEYRRVINNQNTVELGYLEAFQIANEFIAANGGFTTVNGVELTPFIREVEIIPVTGQSGFRFTFGVKPGEGRIFYQRGETMIVDVVNGTVSYFKRQMINIDMEQVKSTQDDFREVFSPLLNLIAFNMETIWETLVDLQGISESDLATDTEINIILEKISRLDSGYVRICGNEDILKAAWILTIYGLEFYFDIDEGHLFGYRQR
jgi:hypothetical protein